MALLVIYCIAAKYIRGDYTKVKQENGNEPLETGSKLEDSNDLKSPIEPYEEYSQQAARSKIKESGFEGKFSSKASVIISLKYHQDARRLAVIIKSVEDWDTEAYDTPAEITFHWKILPKKKLRGRTAYKKTNNKMLVLSFFIGPVEYEELLRGALCVRMYGRMKGFRKKQKCYGEFFINVNSIVGKTKPAEFRKKLMPKATYVAEEHEEEEFYFSSTDPEEYTDPDETEYTRDGADVELLGLVWTFHQTWIFKTFLFKYIFIYISTIHIWTYAHK